MVVVDSSERPRRESDALRYPSLARK
eukprot:SAG31_NODE_6948_length_1840_cov_1.426766_1_plen_25_part_10